MNTPQKECTVYVQNRAIHPLTKENMPLRSTSPNPSTVLSYSNMQQNSPINSRILQSQWLNVTNQPISSRITSPKSFVHSIHPKEPRLIELGGSKEKRQNRQKAVSNCSTQTQGNNVPVNQNLIRKVTMLQNRVKELHVQKQYLAVQLNKRVRALEQENEKLISVIKSQEGSKTSRTQNNDEFDYEEELTNQININLELREQLESITKEYEEHKQREQQQTFELNNLGDEKAELKLQLIQLQDSSQEQIQKLKENISALEQAAAKKDQNFTFILDQKQKRILELEEEAFSLNNRISERQQLNEKLSQEVSDLRKDHETAKNQLLFLHARVAELEKPVECKKCKDLLHTVFRLNSQLNKK